MLKTTWIALLLALAVISGCDDGAKNKPAAAQKAERVDLLVFAPHPDDEALGCAGIIRQAIAAGKRVKVVLFTNGDGFPAFAASIVHRAQDKMTPEDFLELARFRQIQTRNAFAALGGNPDELIFLGYPDSGLAQVYENKDAAPFTQKFTLKSETYGVAQPDYHSARHGRPAPYTYAAVLSDVVEIIQAYRPAQICVTNEADLHRDHKASFWFVRDGVNAAKFRGAFNTYLVHGGTEWPWPKGPTPDATLETREVKGERNPLGVPWPPPLRIPISREANALKLKAIQAHATHLTEATEATEPGKRQYLESFVKAEEVFWPIKLK